MESKSKNKGIWIFGAILLILILVIFVPGLIEDKNSLDTARLEYNLIKEGKTVSGDIIIEEIVQILKNRDEEKLKAYLTDDFSYWDNNNHESKFISGFWTDLKYLVEEKYDIEKRANDIKNQETYRIYWNTNDLVKERTDRLYCLQEITIVLNRIVKEDIITYEIEKIILKNR